MGQYQPDTANELAGVIIDVFRGLKKDGGPPLAEAYKAALQLFSGLESAETADEAVAHSSFLSGIE